MIDTSNQFGVGGHDESVIILFPPAQKLTPTEAMRFAAWLAVVAEIVAQTNDHLDVPLFDDVLSAVKAT